MSLLEVRGLRKQYGSRVVVNGVEFDVNAGEIVGLLGPNGAGKTTSFRMVVGMIAPKAGKVIFNQKEITHLPMYQRARLGLGYLAQDSSVFRRLTVEQNLFAILELMTTRRGEPYRANRAQQRARVDELLEQFGLTRLRKSISGNLSGGERRRLEIARCLVSEPMLIMLDEPFTGIDPKTVGDIQGIIENLKYSGIGVLITDHHVAETLRITDRSYLIADGKMLCHGTPLDIINDPRAREAYLGENFSAAAITEAIKKRDRPAASVKVMLGEETVNDALIHVGHMDPIQLASLLRPRARFSAHRLIDLMENGEPIMRSHAHRVLCELLSTQLPFDPQANDVIRLQQTSRIRQYLDQRLAG
jgi:lipopolysaccharide export system ATP-binding protein